MGKKLNFLIKGDNNSKYTAFKGVIDAFKKNDIYKYNLVTNAEDVPEGAELYKKKWLAKRCKTNKVKINYLKNKILLLWQKWK